MTSMVSPDAPLREAAPLKAVLETAIDGLIAIDERGAICSFNAAAVNIFGYTPEEVIGRNVKMLMPEPCHCGHDGWLGNDQNTGVPTIIGMGREVRACRKDGSTFPIDLGVTAMHIGDVRMYVCVIRDITQRRLEEANRIFLQNLIDNIGDGLITIEESGTVLRMTPSAQRMFGYADEEIIGRNVEMLLAEPDQRGHDGWLKHFRAAGEAKTVGAGGREVVARRKDGSTFPMELSVSQMWLEGRRIFAGLLRDVSARKALESERQQSIADLARSNQELDDFAYIASHDLKEPLRGVANNAIFLKEDYEKLLDERGGKRLDRMIFLCQRMERLVDDLLYFSRLGRQKLAVQRTDLNAVIKEVERQLEATLQQQNVELVISRPLPVIACDAPRVTEVFISLINNGIKYNRSNRPRIEVGWGSATGSAAEPEIVFHVRDNGIGIPAEFHREIFRIFKRLNQEEDAQKGTGVGLTFVQKIIERHNGRIWVESEAGSGSTFYFTLGAVQEAPGR